jgi:hypothetical protein
MTDHVAREFFGLKRNSLEYSVPRGPSGRGAKYVTASTKVLPSKQSLALELKAAENRVLELIACQDLRFKFKCCSMKSV